MGNFCKLVGNIGQLSMKNYKMYEQHIVKNIVTVVTRQNLS